MDAAPGYTFDGATYSFTVTTLTCERCSAHPTYVLSERRLGGQVFLCKRHLQPWLDERRWAVLRMAYPYASKAEADQLFPHVVEVIQQ